ncbi:MAG: flagellar export protein FliJ [Thermoguttaceae bacterium]|jgi:flagellar FliJ protein
MSQFQFRLATLLRLREVTRDQRRAALAEAYRVDAVLRERLGRVVAEIEALKAECRQAAAPGAVDVQRLVQAQRYELALRLQHAQIARQCETVAAEIQRRQQMLLEANRDVRTLEKLRDRQAEKHALEQQRQDAKRMDEIAQQRFMRQVMTAEPGEMQSGELIQRQAMLGGTGRRLSHRCQENVP